MAIRVPVRLGSLRASVRESSPGGVAVHDASRERGAALLSSASAARVCRVCTQHAARYTCPRCNAPYCCVACFQRHGDACTERFYEEMVRDVAALDDADGGKREVGELLARVKRFQDESADNVDLDRGSDGDDDDEDEDEALERLEALVLADEQQLSLDDLTPAQRRQFLAEVADGRLGKFVKLWQPWWCLEPRVYARETAGKRRQLVIQEISSSRVAASCDAQETEEEEQLEPGAVLIESAAFPAEIFTDAAAKAMPESLETLLRGRAPSPALRFHLVEILFSYALVLRTFNGDWQQAAGDAATLLLHLSAVLTHTDAKLDAVDLVLHACLRKRVDVAYDGDSAVRVDSVSSSSSATDVNQRVVHDVALLLASRVFLLDALSDARALVAASQSLLVATAGGRKRERQALKRLELVEKKLQFFQTWVFVTPEQLFEATARDLEQAAAELAGSR